MLDIWGNYAIRGNRKRADNIIKFFSKIQRRRREKWQFQNSRIVYQLKKRYTFFIPKRLKKKIVKLRLFRYFYMYFSKYTLYKWFQFSIKGMNYFFENYLRVLEGNLMMLVYRLNFVSNLFIIYFLIRRGHFMINWKQKFMYKESLKSGEWFGVCKRYINFYKKDMYFRLKKDLIYQGGLKNIIRFDIFLLYLFKSNYTLKSFMNPVKIDILRVHDLFRDYR